jgi:hypothetical protein
MWSELKWLKICPNGGSLSTGMDPRVLECPPTVEDCVPMEYFPPARFN